MTRKLTAALLITAAITTNAAFTALGTIFNYPDVLKEPVDNVLAAFRASQGAVTGWFSVMALSAALFAPIAIGVGRLSTRRTMGLAVPVGVAAAVVQVIGLLRWTLGEPRGGEPATGDPASDSGQDQQRPDSGEAVAERLSHDVAEQVVCGGERVTGCGRDSGIGAARVRGVTGNQHDPAAALIGGTLTGLVLGAGQALASRRRVDPRRWAAATALGMGLGLLLGATAVDYRTSLADLPLMGALTGVVLGLTQSLALPRRTHLRWIWAAAMPALWALGWTATTLGGISVDEQFTIYGAYGAVTFSALSGLLLHQLLPLRASTGPLSAHAPIGASA